MLVVGMNTGLNFSCRFFQGFIHHHTISPLTDHTRQKTWDTWFVAGLKSRQLIETVQKHWTSASNSGLTKKLSRTVCFYSLVFMKGLLNTIDYRLSSTSAAEDLLSFFFQPSRGYIFTANRCTCQLFEAIWQVNNTKLELVVLWQLFQLMSGQCGIVWLHKVSECFFSWRVSVHAIPSSPTTLCYCRWVTTRSFLLLLACNCANACVFKGRGGGAE